jgi:outer membrane immunogenic protein
MKGLLRGSVALVAIVTVGGSSLAADLPAKPSVYKAAPAIAPAYNWTGFYVGLNAGYSWGKTGIAYGQDFPAGVFVEPFGIPGCGLGCPLGFDLSPASAIGGAQIGYNWQAAGSSAVIGIEADIAWRNGEDSVVHAINPFDVLTLTTSQRWLGTVRGRLGWGDGPWLIYATGGVAFGNVKHEVVQCDDCGVAGTSIRRFERAKTKTGWGVGIGGEFGFTPNWSLGVEYLYVDLGSTTVSAPLEITGATFFATNVTFDDRSHILRAKLNYRFGPGPVIARY